MTQEDQTDWPPQYGFGSVQAPKPSIEDPAFPQKSPTNARPFNRFASKAGIPVKEFDLNDLAEISDAWGMRLHFGTLRGTSKIDRGVLQTRTFGGTTVSIKPTGIRFDGRETDQATPPVGFLRAIDGSLEHAKQFWGSRVTIDGSENFKMNYWARAAMEGVTIDNYVPEGSMATRAYLTLVREQGIKNRESRAPVTDSDLAQQEKTREKARSALGISKELADQFGQLTLAQHYDVINGKPLPKVKETEPRDPAPTPKKAGPSFGYSARLA